MSARCAKRRFRDGKSAPHTLHSTPPSTPLAPPLAPTPGGGCGGGARRLRRARGARAPRPAPPSPGGEPLSALPRSLPFPPSPSVGAARAPGTSGRLSLEPAPAATPVLFRGAATPAPLEPFSSSDVTSSSASSRSRRASSSASPAPSAPEPAPARRAPRRALRAGARAASSASVSSTSLASAASCASAAASAAPLSCPPRPPRAPSEPPAAAGCVQNAHLRPGAYLLRRRRRGGRGGRGGARAARGLARVLLLQLCARAREHARVAPSRERHQLPHLPAERALRKGSKPERAQSRKGLKARKGFELFSNAPRVLEEAPTGVGGAGAGRGLRGEGAAGLRGELAVGLVDAAALPAVLRSPRVEPARKQRARGRKGAPARVEVLCLAPRRARGPEPGQRRAALPRGLRGTKRVERRAKHLRGAGTAEAPLGRVHGSRRCGEGRLGGRGAW